MRQVRASIKITVFALSCILAIPVQACILSFSKGRFSYWLPRLWHSFILRVFGIRCNVEGKPLTQGQVIYISNHLSYMDIIALGSLLPTSFVAKKEVSTWPLFGTLARLQQTVYVDRRRTAFKQAKNEAEKFMAGGNSLVIFPEGTSTDGQTVYPFKAGFFSLAFGPEREDLTIQPVSITVLEADGRRPETQADRDLYAWHINMDTPLFTHLWQLAQASGIRLGLTFHEPLAARDYPDRKSLAKACHSIVSKKA